jgi:hypothetical protein
MSLDNYHGKGVDAEAVFPPEINSVAVMRKAVALVTAALVPIVMFEGPMLRAPLLPYHALFVNDMPRRFRNMTRHVLVVARRDSPPTWLGMFNSLRSVLLHYPVMVTLRLFAFMLLASARLSRFGLLFVSTFLVARLSSLAISRNSGSQN